MVGTYGRARTGIVVSVDDADSALVPLNGGAVIFPTADYDDLQIDLHDIGGANGKITTVVDISGASKTS